jgi:enolase
MSAIRAILAKEILDSQGHPTIKVSLWTDDGFFVESHIPNASKALPHEGQPLIDNDPEHKSGKGVLKAVELINQTFAPQLVGKDPSQQEQLDKILIDLDGTELKSQFGVNTIAAVSQVIFKAGAAILGMSVYQRLFEQYKLVSYLKIPTCIFGLINGGKYGSGNLDIQEFLIMPASHIDYRVSLEIEDAMRTNLYQLLKERGAGYSTGLLGGFTPSLQKNTDVFEFIIEASHKTDYILSRDFFFGIDAGAEDMVDRGKYSLRDKSTAYSEKEISDYYKNLKEKYNVTYFEDPFTTKDTELWKGFTADLDGAAKVVLDSLTVTNTKKIQEAVQNKYGNAIIIKPSQIGTVTEAIQAVKAAKDAGWSTVVSQRSGETNDDFLADFAVGSGADYVKFGPTNRGEAVEKYNRLADIYLEIEQQMLEGENMDQSNPQDPSTNPVATDATQPAATPAATDATQPATPAVNPFEPAQEETPAEAPTAPVAEKPAEPVAAAPEKPLTLGETPAPAAPPVADAGMAAQPPMNAPTATPAAPVTPVVEPAVAQEAIDSTLAEISPTAEKPAEAPAETPAEPAVEKPAEPTA